MEKERIIVIIIIIILMIMFFDLSVTTVTYRMTMMLWSNHMVADIGPLETKKSEIAPG